MNLVEADAYASKPAAYVHVPFCSALCPYCDFAVSVGQDHLIDRYVDAVTAEISMSEPWKPLDSIYFGGGTPSHLHPKCLGKILNALDSRHGIADGAEVSLEANPEDFDFETARKLRRVGFNRVSFGAQSFDDAVLASLGRRHGADDIRRSVWAARIAGFDDVSIDLIFGTPGETMTSWHQTLEEAVDLNTDHVSCYSLTVERGTELSRSVIGGAPAPDPDLQADMYEAAERALTDAGLPRYEVSNWAKPGRECRYNLTVWARGEYEAYGNGAHGHRRGERFRNIRRLDAYLDEVGKGVKPRAGADVIVGWEAEVERLFVGLRRTVGVANGPAVRALLESEDGQRLLAADVISPGDDRLVIDRPLLTDEVHRAVLDLDPPEWWAEGERADNVSPDA